MRPVTLLLAGVVFCGPWSTTAGFGEVARFPGRSWERVEPSAMGWSERGLNEARRQFREMDSTSLLIVHDGRVVVSWGDNEQPVKIHSVRKSLLSALFGIAVEGRQIELNRTLAELQIDDKPPSLTAIEKRASVRDLLQARSGVYHEAAAETRAMKRLRPKRGSHAPGTYWYYNNWDFNALGTILRNATGEDTFAAVEKHIARPLGMQHFSARDGEYIRQPVSDHPAYHMRVTGFDLARFGWLFLNRGRWGNRQIIPAAWVAESTRPWTLNARSGVAYGYMWWASMNNRHFRTDVGPGSFSARGSGGQFIVVVPARRIVVVHLNDLDDNDRLESGEFNTLMRLIFDAAPR